MRQEPTDIEAADVVVEMKDAIGDRDLNVLVRRYSPLVLATCLKITGNRHDAEDAAQAVFLCLAVQLRGGRRIRALGPWLHRVASHASIDICRRRKRRKSREDVYARAVEAGANDPLGSTLSDQAELRGTMQLALGELPAKYRLPLILHYFGGLTHAELSKELGCTRSTLRVRMHRGHKLLRDGLKRHGVELAETAIMGFLAAAVKWQVSDSLLTGMVASGSKARLVGLQAVGASPDVMAAACEVLAPRLVRLKFMMWLGLAATGLATAGGTLWAKLRDEVRDWPEVPSIRDVGEKLIPTFTVPKLPLLKLPLSQGPAGVDGVGAQSIARHGGLGGDPADALAGPEGHRQGPPVNSFSHAMGWDNSYSTSASMSITKSAIPASGLAPLIHGPGTPVAGYVKPDPFPGSKILANHSGFAGSGASAFAQGVHPASPEQNVQVSKPGGGKSTPSSVDPPERTPTAPPSNPIVSQPCDPGPAVSIRPATVDVQIWPFFMADGAPDGPSDDLLVPLPLSSPVLPEFPTGHRLLIAWLVNQQTAPDCGFDVRAHYSDQTLINGGFDERYLKLWYYDAGWHRVSDESFFLDNEGNTLGGHIPDGSSFVLVSTPEPTIICMGLVFAAGALLRRRSRK